MISIFSSLNLPCTEPTQSLDSSSTMNRSVALRRALYIFDQWQVFERIAAHVGRIRSLLRWIAGRNMILPYPPSRYFDFCFFFFCHHIVAFFWDLLMDILEILVVFFSSLL